MSFFQELKRRNVVRVGIAYAVGAWVLLQIFDVIGEILVLPEWGGKLILALIILGFFLALFFAWAFELTPEGIKREHEVDRSQSIAPQTGKKLNSAILVLMAVAIAYLLFDKFYLSQQLEMARPEQAQQAADQPPGPPAAGADAPAAKPVDRQSIAVLPFDNRSRQEEDEFFVAGIHDDLLTSLARIGSLKVISRTSVTKYRNTEKSIPEIAAELGVATVMEGAVQRSGNTVRINVQLIDAQTDEHLWAEIFDRELTADNLFSIQSEISAEIAKALAATLSPAEQQRLSERPTENLAAYNAFLRGRQLMVRRSSAELDQAAKEFQRAVELDPEFALAWVGVAEVASLREDYSSLDAVESREQRRQAVDRALAIDPDLGEAHLSLALLYSNLERFDEAEAEFRRAIELSPGYATAYHWYANFAAQYPSRLQESVQLLQRALELDPLSSVVRLNMANRNIALGRFDEAAQQLDRLQDLDPDFPPVFTSRAALSFAQGRLDERIRWIRKGIATDPGRLWNYMPLVWAYVDLSDLEPMEEIKLRMAEINDQHVALGFADLVISVYRGNYDAALELSRWASRRSGDLPSIRRIEAYVQNMRRDYSAARAAFEAAGPEFFDRGRWRAAIERTPDDACFAAWLMVRTGSEELGLDLARTTVDYLENELPRYILHADRYAPDQCYLTLGEPERALAAIEQRVADRHYGGWWFLGRAPEYEPLRGDPRFEAALQKVEDELAIQRARLARTETASLLP